MSSTTPNMGLIAPGVLITTGPTWATNINGDLSTVDSHDHSNGKGAPLTVSGLATQSQAFVNADLSYLGFGPVSQSYSRFVNTTQPAAGTLLDSIYVSTISGGQELWFQDGAGNNVQITSGGHIQPNGTGTANGFYGDYASSVAHARYTLSSLSYLFYTTASETTLATVVAAGFRSVLSAGTGNSFTAAPNTTTGGWTLNTTTISSSPAFNLNFDQANSGAYNVTALTVARDGTSGTSYRFGFNNAAPTVPYEFSYQQASVNNAPIPMMNIDALTSVSGIVATGFGSRLTFKATVNGTTPTTTQNQAAIDSFNNNNAATSSGLRLRGALSGTLTSTPGVEIVYSNTLSHDVVGINTVANTSYTLTLGGDTVPGVTDSYSLGDSTHSFLNFWTRNLSSDGSLALAAAADVSVTAVGNLTLTSQQTILNTVVMKPNVAGGTDLGAQSLPFASINVKNTAFANSFSSHGAYLAGPMQTPLNAADLTNRHAGNNCVAWGNFTVNRSTNAISLNAGWNILSVAPVSAGNFQILFNVAVSINSAAGVTLQGSVNLITNTTATLTASGGQLNVNFALGGSPTNPDGFNIFVFGPPSGTV